MVKSLFTIVFSNRILRAKGTMYMNLSIKGDLKLLLHTLRTT